MITLQNLSLARGSQLLIESSGLEIHPNQRVGLIGRNGSGKSSLFALLNQEIDCDAGDCRIPDHWTIANVRQDTPALQQKALDYVLDGHPLFRSIQAEIVAAEESGDGIAIAKAHEKFALIQGYEQNAKAANLLSGLGFDINKQQNQVADFSGGWRMRLNLAQALISPAQLLLLDEPTNHLDLDAIIWLQDFLAKHVATQIIISHDKDFLDALCTHTIHLENNKLTLYRGNYSQFESQYQSKRMQEQAFFEKQQTQKSHLQSYIDRFKAKASKAKQAQSRVKALEKLTATSPPAQEKDFQLYFPDAAYYPNPLIQINHVDLGYGDKILLKDVNLTIENESRIGLLGRNGAGKSTLIKAIAGLLKPLSGEINQHQYAQIGYFSQHQLEYLQPSQTPLWHMQQQFPNILIQQHRNFLGKYGFSGDSIDSPIEHFSGGEKARLALALIIAKSPNILLLDEPTNHLDLSMRHHLAIALQNFKGAMLIISHDRSLLRTTCDRFLLVEDGQCVYFNGDLEDYRTHLKQAQLSNDKPSVNQIDKTTKLDIRRQSAQIRQQLQPLKKQLTVAEKKLDDLSQKIQSLENLLAETHLYEDSSKDKLKALLEEKQELEKALHKAEEDWMSAAENLQKAESLITSA